LELENRGNAKGIFGGREGNGNFFVRQDANIKVDIDF